MENNNFLLKVNNLKTYFYLDEGILKAVDGVSFKIEEKKVLGLVGESGCGKSVTAQSILRIVPPPGKVEGEILLHQKNGNLKKESLDLARLDPQGKKIRSIRGKEIAMIFQEPMTSFSPLHTIGNQIMEAILLHQNVNKKEARDLAIDMLDKVGMPRSENNFLYSGGIPLLVMTLLIASRGAMFIKATHLKRI